MPLRFVLIFSAAAALSAFSPASAQTTAPQEPPISASVRARWLADKNFGLGAIAGDIALAGINTAANSPEEYGPHWTGFGKRVGLVAANTAVKSTMEVGLGSLWGEDPRYFRTQGLPMKARLAHVIVSAFTARNANGATSPAYARFIAIPGSNFLENQWMPDSEATVNQALLRTGLGFLGRMGGNAWKEFVRRK